MKRITPEYIAKINLQVNFLTSPERIVKDYPTFDEFLDWCEVDIGLPLERRLKVLLYVENNFKEAGYLEHAKIINMVYNKLKL